MEKKMQYIRFFALAFIMLFSAGAFAQERTTEEKAKEITEKMKADLSLSGSQPDRVYAINYDFVQKVEKGKAEEASRRDKLKKLKALDEERDAALKEVLTSEQFEKFESGKKEKRQKLKEDFKQRRKG